MVRDSNDTNGHLCQYLDKCALILDNKDKMPELVARFKDEYCLNRSYCECARFHMTHTLGLDAVPQLMLPSQTEWARQIIEDRDFDQLKESQLADV